MKALLIWNNLWADRCACVHPGLIWSTCPMCTGLFPPTVLRCSSAFLPRPWISTLAETCCLFSPPLMFHFFYQLIVSLFSITSPPTCSFRHTSFPYFHLSSLHFLQRWGCPMNNSEALRDDNGKLEVRLCVAGVCRRLADSFQPGGNRKRLFIHIIYVNKMTLLFKVSERGRVTTNLDAAGR